MTCPNCRGSGGLGPCPGCGAEPSTDVLAAWLQCTDLKVVRSLIDDWKAAAAKLAENHRLACQELSSVVGALQSVRVKCDAHLADLKMVEASREELLADKEALALEVANLREAFQGAWETIEYWKKQAKKHRAERDKQFANVTEWQDALGYLSPGIAAADFERYKAALLEISEANRPRLNDGGEAGAVASEVMTTMENHGIDPEELKPADSVKR